ncbi:hypothetical protein [Solemya elarraichensis gill symbiont]|uniref:Uncharacterized protein n=1 Tax=Solemya elarraichensis gill symbiont TaxID=1918949 RepID=A0A1T2KSS1_9GAMM|nr:hypothetical protein [Solemya elarraichensis gill symbiont]OOZ35919.1 hypothetical protein BOW52_11055 [Solemya elarraichensis gill symbiont]
MATLNLHFFNQTRGIDFNESYCLELPINKGSVDLDWESANSEAESRPLRAKERESKARSPR